MEEVFQAAEHSLNCAAVAVEEGREAVPPFAVRVGWNVRHHPALLSLTTYGIGVIAFVSVHDVVLGNLFKQLGA
jgi:hypothetical protein